jgi:hypothetical protein
MAIRFGLSGAATLRELLDVAITSPAQGHTIARNGTEFRNRMAVERNIDDFDAPTDGVTDVYTALLAAYNSLPATGGTIIIPERAYVLGTHLMPNKPNVWIRGAGWGSVLKAAPGAALADMLVWLAPGGGLRDLKLDGNRANGGMQESAGMMVAVLASDVALECVEVTGGTRFAIGVGGGVDGFLLDHSKVHNNGMSADVWGTGLWAGNSPRPKNLEILSTRFELNTGLLAPRNGGGAIALDAERVRIDGGYLLNNYNGGGQIVDLTTQGTERRWRISNVPIICTSDPTATSGIEFNGVDLDVSGVDIDGGNGTGIALQSSGVIEMGTVRVTGGSIRNKPSGITQIAAGGTMKGLTVTGVKLADLTTGIELQTYASQVNILGNDFSDSVTTPIVDPGNVAQRIGNLPSSIENRLLGTLALTGAAATANPDTSGATLPDLEIEVNQLKAMLRSAGLLAT